MPPLVFTRTCLVLSCLRIPLLWLPFCFLVNLAKVLVSLLERIQQYFSLEHGARDPTLGPLSFKICKGLSRGCYQRTIYTNFGFHTLNLGRTRTIGEMWDGTSGCARNSPIGAVEYGYDRM